MVVLGIVSAYLIGSIPFALVLARRWGGHDLHRVGSGNIGAANVLRASGLRAGVVVAVLDVAKGAAGVILAGQMASQGYAAALAGVAAGVIQVGWLFAPGAMKPEWSGRTSYVIAPDGVVVCGALGASSREALETWLTAARAGKECV